VLNERIYTVADISQWLRIREPKIREAIHQGDLRASRIGRLFRIREQDIFDWLDATVEECTDGE
jgi:excisionase family DNA binding protein